MKPFSASNGNFISVGDVKQFAYCPRIPYFTCFLGLKPPSTFLMRKGETEETDFSQKQKRHTLSRFGLEAGTRHRRVTLSSRKLSLTGIVDLIIESVSELIVVDFKSAGNTSSENHAVQLAAYSLLAEEHFGKPCRRGFLFYSRDKKWVAIPMTEELRKKTLSLVVELNNMIRRGILPEPADRIEKCRNCEFLNFCGDRW